ncbi:MAG: hypothetical protein ABEI13_02570, partial [Candidatus Paceibacteria bacterium]
ASEGLLLSRNKVQGDSTATSGDFVVLDRGNVVGGANVTISGGEGNAGAPVTFAVAQGSGSGLDADTVDGYEASAMAMRGENETITGPWRFRGGNGSIRLVNKNDTTRTIRIGQHGASSSALRWVPYIDDGTGFLFGKDFGFDFNKQRWYFDPILDADISGNADTVDGYHGSDLAALSENETFTNG